MLSSPNLSSEKEDGWEEGKESHPALCLLGWPQSLAQPVCGGCIETWLPTQPASLLCYTHRSRGWGSSASHVWTFLILALGPLLKHSDFFLFSFCQYCSLGGAVLGGAALKQ